MEAFTDTLLIVCKCFKEVSYSKIVLVFVFVLTFLDAFHITMKAFRAYLRRCKSNIAVVLQ